MSSRPARHALLSTRLLVSLLLALPLTAPTFAADGDRRAEGIVALRQADIQWLSHASFGLDSQTVQRYQQLGRKAYLTQALRGEEDPLPDGIRALMDSYPALTTPPEALLEQLYQQQEQIKQMPDGDAKVAAKKALQQQGNALAQQAQQAELLHAIYGSNQLKEQLVWFWLNHFSVYAPKARVRWLAADYAEHTIRPRALGKFKDLVMATLKSPAMLEYLDNAQNAKGKVNENYARELMELHTLGVHGGYSQQDVQQLALILTGAGLVPADGRARPLPPHLASLEVRDGLFDFNPARHDFSDKHFLGQTIQGSGYQEIEQAVDLIVHQPACARFIAGQLAEYFLGDHPPAKLVDKMARSFTRSDGDIAVVMRTLFESPEMSAAQSQQFKDPTRFLVSAMRLAYDGQPIANAKPLLNWINQLGESPFGRITPDGWPLDSTAWSSSGQLSKRFEIARAIGFGSNQLFTPEGQPKQRPGFPMLTSRLYYEAIEPRLSGATRDGLAKAQSQQEWNTFLLASPDFNYR